MPNEELLFRLRSTVEGLSQGIAAAKKELGGLGTAYTEEEQRRKAAEKAVADGAKAEAAAVKKAKADETAARKQAEAEAKKAAEATATAAKQSADAEKAAQEKANAELMLTTAVAAAAAVALYGLFNAVKSGINTYNQYTAALRGLQGVAEKTNTSMTSLIAANQAVTKDGLITPAQVSQSMKNLLMYGYSVQEATDLLYRLKDAAAYNRQENYSLGEAVVATTEGIRMENSILSDAAGVTKNIAKMYDEYAKSLGVTTESLTQAQKAQGVYQGMMTETEVVVGNAAKLSQEFAGKQAELDAQTMKLESAFGGAVSGGLSPFLELLTSGAQALTDWIDNNRLLVSIMTTMTATVLGLIALLGVKAALIKLVGMVSLTTAGEVTTLSGAFTALYAAAGGPAGVAVAVVLAVIVGVVTAIGTAAADAKKHAEALRQEIESLSENNAGVSDLVAEYEDLSNKTLKTADDTQRMLDIRAELVATYGYSAEAVDSEGRLLSGNLETMKEQLKVQQQLYLAKLKEGAAQNQNDYNDALSKRSTLLADIAAKEKDIADPTRVLGEVGSRYSAEDFASYSSVWNDQLQSLYDELDSGDAKAKTAMQNMLKQMVGTLQDDGKTVPEALQTYVMDAMTDAWNSGADANTIGNSLFAQYFAIDESVVQSSVASIQTLRTALIEAFSSSGSTDVSSSIVNDLLATVMGDAGQQAAFARGEELRAKILSGVATSSESDEYDAIRQALSGDIQTALDDVEEKVTRGIPGTTAASTALKAMAGNYKQTAAELKSAAAAASVADKSLKDAASSLRSVASSYETANKEINEVSGLKGAVQAIEDYNNASVKTAALTKNNTAAKAYLANAYGVEASAVDGMLPGIQDDINMKEALALADYALGVQAATTAMAQVTAMMSMGTITQTEGAKMINALQGVIDKMAELSNTGLVSAIPSDTFGGMPSGYQSQYQSKKIKTGPFSLDDSGSSGGGGSSSTTNAELEKQIALLNHKKALDQLTTQQEIDGLQLALDTYAKTTAEKEDLVEKIYALKKQKLEDDLNAQTSAIDRDVARDRITAQEEIDLRQKVIDNYAMTNEKKQELEEQLYTLMRQREQANLDYRKAMDQLTLREEIAAMDKLIATYKAGTDARLDLEQKRYEAAKELERQEYDLKVYYGQLTLQQQAAYISQMISEYKEGTDERIDLEKELYQIQQQIRQANIDKLNDLSDAVISALTARYEAQREAEDATLQSSSDAWKQWSDDQVSAIQAQIDALDDLAKQEDQDDTERAKRKKIAALEQQILYEQDAYNKRKLQQELASEESDLADWQADNARAALKATLQDQITAVKSTASTEQDKIQAQITANDAYYADLEKKQNLQAEAQKLIMQSSQDSIITLLKSYASDYNVTGQSLGEQLVDGFTSKVGSIESWFSGLNSRLSAYQTQLASVANAAADQYYSSRGLSSTSATTADTSTVAKQTTINLYFTETQSSATEIRREIERLSEQLSDL